MNLSAEAGRIREVITEEITMIPQSDGPPRIEILPDTQRRWPADLVLIAIGYSGPETHPLAAVNSTWTSTPTGTIATDDRSMTSVTGIFAAGDASQGQSLIVRAISDGREAARQVDISLTGQSQLPAKGCCDLPLIR